MARLSIDLPEEFIFTTEILVRASDLNYGGHVGNDSILTLFQEARILFYRYMGFKSELNLEGSVGQLMSDAAVVYKSESFLGDELIIQIAVADFNKYGFDLLYKMSNKKTGKEVARGKTGIVCFDYEKRKVASVPAVLKIKLTGTA
jgi:acyl-CoA thioesterase FadM